jgi:hypothetical protein
LQLPGDMEQELRKVGEDLGIGLGPAIRVVLRRWLDLEHVDSGRDSSAAVAGLIAAEQTLLVVASILPGGQSLVADLAGEAAAAAERRIAQVEEAPTDEAQP